MSNEKKLKIYLAGPFTVPEWRDDVTSYVKKMKLDIDLINPIIHTPQTSITDIVNGDIYKGSMCSEICLFYKPPHNAETIGAVIEAASAHVSGKLVTYVNKNLESNFVESFSDFKYENFEKFLSELKEKEEIFLQKLIEKQKINDIFQQRTEFLHGSRGRLTYFLAGDYGAWKDKIIAATRDIKKRFTPKFINKNGKKQNNLEKIKDADWLIINLERKPGKKTWQTEMKASAQAAVAFKCKMPIIYLEGTSTPHPLLEGISYRTFTGATAIDDLIFYLARVVRRKTEFEAVYDLKIKQGSL